MRRIGEVGSGKMKWEEGVRRKSRTCKYRKYYKLCHWPTQNCTVLQLMGICAQDGCDSKISNQSEIIIKKRNYSTRYLSVTWTCPISVPVPRLNRKKQDTNSPILLARLSHLRQRKKNTLICFNFLPVIPGGFMSSTSWL